MAAARAADAKGASDVVILEVGDVLVVADEFVVASASNDRLVKAIVDEIEREIAEIPDLDGNQKPLRIEGRNERRWVLMDYGDVVIHVFLQEVRDYYELERLWADVSRIEWAVPAPAATAR